jgi:hypothetical protein
MTTARQTPPTELAEAITRHRPRRERHPTGGFCDACTLLAEVDRLNAEVMEATDAVLGVRIATYAERDALRKERDRLMDERDQLRAALATAQSANTARGETIASLKGVVEFVDGVENVDPMELRLNPELYVKPRKAGKP